jgi:O-succinylbenzoate synthase
VRLPLLTPFTIATGTMTEKVFPLLTLVSDGLEGHAEGVMDPLPDYLEETVTGALHLMTAALLPAILGKRFENPEALARTLSPWRGNHMARATVEMAFWDLWARSLDLPLQTVLGGQGAAIPVGVSLGIAPVEVTLDRVAGHLAQGYRRIKLKVARGHDLRLLEAVRARFPDAHLTVDANCAYTLADMGTLLAMDRFALDYIEQPLAWDDIHDHAVLQGRLATALCLDESLRTPAHVRKALVAGAGRVVNIKVGRVGGHMAARAIHDLCAAFDVPVWCGGMLEAGVGRAHNIHLATLPGFSRPGDTSSASRYFARDIIEERLECEDGLMPVPPGPGTGVTLDHDFLGRIAPEVQEMRA